MTDPAAPPPAPSASIHRHPAMTAPTSMSVKELLDPDARLEPDPLTLDLLDQSGNVRNPTVLGTLRNIVCVLSHDPRWGSRLRWDDFRNAVFYGPDKLHESHVVEIGIWLDQVYKLRAPSNRITEAVDYWARRSPVHPVRDYLNALVWDETPRIDGWLTTYLGVQDSPLVRAIARKWLLSAVARVQKPGCKVDTVLVLAGQQGLGKSTALKALAGDAWFSDSDIDLGSKDRFQQLAGKWIYEVAEFQSFRGRDATAIKAYLSSAEDNYRPSFGKTNQDVPRQCVFAATTNDDEILDDPTGSRRFWVVLVLRCDIAGLRRDRDQLWAEAMVALARGEKHHLTEAEEDALRKSNAAFESRDPWTDKVEAHLVGKAWTTVDEIAEVVLGVPTRDMTRGVQMRVAGILRRAGWTRNKATRPVRWHKPTT